MYMYVYMLYKYVYMLYKYVCILYKYVYILYKYVYILYMYVHVRVCCNARIYMYVVQVRIYVVPVFAIITWLIQKEIVFCVDS